MFDNKSNFKHALLLSACVLSLAYPAVQAAVLGDSIRECAQKAISPSSYVQGLRAIAQRLAKNKPAVVGTVLAVVALAGWSLFSSVDAQAENKLKCWHEIRDGEYFWSNDSFTNDGRRMSDVRATFPENDPNSKEKLIKALLLAKHSRLMKEALVALDPEGGESKIISRDVDYETTWNQQPLRDRLWWTVRYRRPSAWASSILRLPYTLLA